MNATKELLKFTGDDLTDPFYSFSFLKAEKNFMKLISYWKMKFFFFEESSSGLILVFWLKKNLLLNQM